MQILGLLGTPPRATHPITASPGTGGSQGLELAGSSRPSLPLPWGSGLRLVLDTVVLRACRPCSAVAPPHSVDGRGLA